MLSIKQLLSEYLMCCRWPNFWFNTNILRCVQRWFISFEAIVRELSTSFCQRNATGAIRRQVSTTFVPCHVSNVLMLLQLCHYRIDYLSHLWSLREMHTMWQYSSPYYSSHIIIRWPFTSDEKLLWQMALIFYIIAGILKKYNYCIFHLT